MLTSEFGQEMSYGRSLERWLKLFGLPLRYTEWAHSPRTGPSGRTSSPANARTNTLSASSTPVFNVTYAHREINHCVVPSFHAAPGVKAGGRDDMAVQSLTAMESKYNEPSEGDNGSGAGLVSRVRIPLTLTPERRVYSYPSDAR